MAFNTGATDGAAAQGADAATASRGSLAATVSTAARVSQATGGEAERLCAALLSAAVAQHFLNSA
ncbi:MAG: hypothetical protein K1X48_12080 [Burkholderiaceae bacterium]|nr:hypothetical protein [Burkholderiaceae bacterium]